MLDDLLVCFDLLVCDDPRVFDDQHNFEPQTPIKRIAEKDFLSLHLTTTLPYRRFPE